MVTAVRASVCNSHVCLKNAASSCQYVRMHECSSAGSKLYRILCICCIDFTHPKCVSVHCIIYCHRTSDSHFFVHRLFFLLLISSCTVFILVVTHSRAQNCCCSSFCFVQESNVVRSLHYDIINI